MNEEKISQITVYAVLGIFIMLILVIIYDKKLEKKQLKEKVYYALEKIQITRYLEYFLFVSFFDVVLSMCLLADGFNITILATIIVITLLFIIIAYLYTRQTIKFMKEKKQILKNGIKVEGTVKDEYVEESYSHGNSTSKLFFMIVEYTYNGKKETYITPQVNFTFYQLKDTNVDVYIYNDKVFVTNFKLK